LPGQANLIMLSPTPFIVFHTEDTFSSFLKCYAVNRKITRKAKLYGKITKDKNERREERKNAIKIRALQRSIWLRYTSTGSLGSI
jgi:hypothetical protein